MNKLEDLPQRYGLVGGHRLRDDYTEEYILECYRNLNVDNLSLEEFNKLLFTPFYVMRKAPSIIDLGIFSAFVIRDSNVLESVTRRFVESQPHVSSIIMNENKIDCFTPFTYLRGIINCAAMDKNGECFGIIRIVRGRSLIRGFSAWRGEIGTNRSLIFLRLFYCYVLFNPNIFGLNEIFHNRPYSLREDVFTKFDISEYSDEAKEFLNKIACTKTSVEEPSDEIKQLFALGTIPYGMLVRSHERKVLIERFKDFDEIRSLAIKLLSK